MKEKNFLNNILLKCKNITDLNINDNNININIENIALLL